MLLKRKSLSINKKNLLFILFFLSYIRPEYLVRIPGISLFYNLLRIVVMLSTVLVFVIKRRRISKFSLIWIVFEGWIILTTIIHSGNISYAINQAISISVIALFFDMYSGDTYRICKCLYWVLSVFVLINFITLLLFPNGMYVTGVTNTASENWFLGFKNKHMIYFLPLTGVTFILGKIEGANWKKIAIMFIVIFSAVYAKSSTTIVGVAVILMIGFLPFIRKHYKLFNMFTYFGIAIAMFIIIPLFRLQYLFSYIIVTILKKSVDLTYRTDLWDRAFAAIRQHPLIGWGEQSNSIKHALYNSQSIITAHNQILEYLYVGGIILLLLYVIINYMLAKRMWKVKSYEVIQIASGIYLALQIALIVEVYTDAMVYMLYFILWNIKELTCLEKKKGI